MLATNGPVSSSTCGVTFRIPSCVEDSPTGRRELQWNRRDRRQGRGTNLSVFLPFHLRTPGAPSAPGPTLSFVAFARRLPVAGPVRPSVSRKSFSPDQPFRITLLSEVYYQWPEKSSKTDRVLPRRRVVRRHVPHRAAHAVEGLVVAEVVVGFVHGRVALLPVPPQFRARQLERVLACRSVKPMISSPS